MEERFGTPESFFREHVILNYCPLVFMEASGRNVTPDKLAAAEREPLTGRCDAHLRTVVSAIRPEWCIGVGGYATRCLERVGTGDAALGTVLHPSPASPAANRGWAEAATKQMRQLGVWP
jgi:single-strand selective monofunctional uracil DNA glycosylase